MTSSHRGAFSLVGLVGVVWFASLTKGAHDLWAAEVLFALLTCTSILFLATSSKRPTPIYLPLISGIVMVWTAFVVSCRFSFDINTSRLELWIWFFSGIAFYLFIHALRDSTSRSQFVKFGSLVMIPITIIAGIQYVRISLMGDTSWTASPTFTNSAVLADVALGWTLMSWHFRNRGFTYRCVFAACLVALLLAASWWSLFSLIIGFTYYYKDQIRCAPSAGRQRRLASILLLTAVLGVLAYMKFSAGSHSMKSFTDRWGWWLAALRMTQDHPWVGVGLGSFGTAYPYFKMQPMLNTIYVHSLPLQLLSEAGCWGAAASLYLVVLYVRLWRTTLAVDAEITAYRATALTLFCFSLTSISMEYFIGKLIFLMAIALSLSTTNLKSMILSRKTAGLLQIGFLVLVPAWFIPFRASQYHVLGLRYEEKGDFAGAQRAFQKSLSMNPLQDESDSQLAHLYRLAYLQSYSLADLAQWHFYMDQALRLKKDIGYATALYHPPNEKPNDRGLK